MGRPLVFDDDKAEAILASLRAGNHMETAAACAGVTRSTLYNWLSAGQRARDRHAKDPTLEWKRAEIEFTRFMDAVDKARAEAVSDNVGIVLAAAKDKWQAAAWWLERTKPDHYGKTQRLELAEAAPVATMDVWIEHAREAEAKLAEFRAAQITEGDDDGE